MDSMQFISDLVLGYTGKDLEKKAAYQRGLSAFCDKCPENHLADVYSHAMTLKYKSVNLLFKFAEEEGFIAKRENQQRKASKFYYSCNGFYKKVQTGEDEKGKPIIELKKFECNTRYSSNSGACPNCGSTSGAVTIPGHWERDQFFEDPFPDDVKFVQRKCFICELYKPGEAGSKGDGVHVHGPGCGTHGNYNSPEGVEYCRSCKCQPCCIDAREEQYHRDNYYYDKKGDRRDIKEPWLKSSRQPGAYVIELDKLSTSKKTASKRV